MPHFLEGKKIVVAGGGIAGLAFAVGLKKLWDPSLRPPEVILYERDTREASIEREGYSLSLHGHAEQDGLVTLQRLGLLDEILASSVLGTNTSGSFRMWDQNWNELARVRPKAYHSLPCGFARIARKALRRILVDAAEEAGASICWESTCTAVSSADGQITVSVADASGTSQQPCDLLIAADGSRSKIRHSLWPDATVQYAGANQIGGSAHFPDGLPDPMRTSFGMVLSWEGVACFVSPVDRQHVVWGISRRGPERRGFEPGLEPEEKRRAVVDEAKQLGHMFAEPFATIVDATEAGSAFLIPARDRPAFPHDEAPEGIVFIGDANHPVSPFAGNGANLALKDGLELAEQLTRAGTLGQAVAAYDASSVPRAQATLKTSHQRIATLHATGVWMVLIRVMLKVVSLYVWVTGGEMA